MRTLLQRLTPSSAAWHRLLPRPIVLMADGLGPGLPPARASLLADLARLRHHALRLPRRATIPADPSAACSCCMTTPRTPFTVQSLAGVRLDQASLRLPVGLRDRAQVPVPVFLRGGTICRPDLGLPG